MGMDVYGKKPSAGVGEYFRRNIRGWHPLADFCQDLAPEITQACSSWHFNDGEGLDAADAAALARELRTALADGRAASYVATRDEALKALPDEPCPTCQGQTAGCNRCDGRGAIRPWATHYFLDLSDIAEFAAFLEACGGFEIC